MDNKKQSLKIFYFGIISQVVTLLMGIIIPRLLIVNYGSEINGLLTSVRQIFVYVALLEAGIGTAALQALYAPIASKDKARTSQIMAATDRYYKRTGTFYGIAVLLLAFIYPLTVRSDISTLTIVAVIIFQGMCGVIRYLFQGKFTILLRVDGRSYITTNAATIVNVATHFSQIILILLGFNIIAVQFVYFIINLAQMLYITFYIKKHYKWLDLKCTPDYKALSQSKNVIIHQISGLVFNNTDVLLLTYFCGLKAVSGYSIYTMFLSIISTAVGYLGNLYSLYTLVISCVSNIIDTICSSVEHVLGQAFNSNRKYFLKLQEVYETYYLAISFAFFTITLIMFPSFIANYSAGITDVNYQDKYLPYLFVALNVLMYARRTSSQILNFAGHFKQTQWRSVLESTINLVVSISLIPFLGIYGVLIGTITALLYRTNDIIIYANKKILERSPLPTYRRWLQNIIIMIALVVAINKLLPQINGWISWVLNACWVAVICIISFVLVDSLCDKTSFKTACEYVKSALKKRV